MILRDELIQIKTVSTPDGSGGFTSKEETQKTFECKASFNTSPEVANAYGTNGEQVLYVITREELDKEAFYLFKDKKYTLRQQVNPNKRFYSSTLIEVK